MLFTEPAFLFAFLPATLFAHTFGPSSWRNVMLLVASLLFYAAGEGVYTLLMLASITGNHRIGRRIERADGRRRRLWLAAGVAGNLVLLGWFKYANFVADNLRALLALVGLGDSALSAALVVDDVHLPIGISFFTFQAIAYLADVYRGQVRGDRPFLHVAVYISLFPQLIAGPIVRFGQVAAEMVARTVTRADFAEGLRRFVVGFGKKMLIANVVAVPADTVYGLPHDELTLAVAWLGTACYALQIYFDFSGYSDMAIGLGRMLGFRFPENFDLPYIARSITEFWRRWHISLSSWFRDYLYIPLGGNRVPAWRLYTNLVVVFFLCGLWHGASWNFVIWGLLHGSFLIVERLPQPRALAAVPLPLRHVWTLALVLFAWVFFRAATPGDALAICAAMLGLAPVVGDVPLTDPVAAERAARLFAELRSNEVVTAMVVGAVAATPLPARAWRWLREQAHERPFAVGSFASAEVVALAAVFYVGLTRVAGSAYDPFIYFRF